MTSDNPQPAEKPKKSARRRGVVIVAVLVVVVLLSLAGYHYSDMTMAEYRASENSHRLLQARAFAESGVHYTAALLADSENYFDMLGGNPWDNPEAFRDIPIMGPDGQPIGRFSIIAPPLPSDPAGPLRYGVTCEAGKLNLNTLMKWDLDQEKNGDLAYQFLMKLPNMTEEIADSIVDWMDPDNDARAGGAENDYYAGLTPPYRAKNGPIDSIDELLLVKGVTPELLYGNDLNRNGFKDENEDGDFNRGWSAFLTVHSREQNRDQENNPYIFLNNPDLEQLYDALEVYVDEDVAKFVVMYRQYPSANLDPSKTPAKSLPLSEYPARKLNRRARYSLNSIFDLVGTQVNTGSSKKPRRYDSPFNDSGAQNDLLAKLLTVATMKDPTLEDGSGNEIPARINVSTAPREVLMTIPPLADHVDNLITVRESLSEEELLTPAWLLTDAKLDVSVLRELDPYVTARSQVYRIQSVGYFIGKGPSFRIEAVVDTNSGRPRIVAWRDLTELGKGWTPPAP